MHIRHLPSFFSTNSTRAPYGLWLVRIKPWARRLLTCSSSSSCSAGRNRYGVRYVGSLPGCTSMECTTSRFGGSPFGSSSLNTSRYSASIVCSFAWCSFRHTVNDRFGSLFNRLEILLWTHSLAVFPFCLLGYTMGILWNNVAQTRGFASSSRSSPSLSRELFCFYDA